MKADALRNEGAHAGPCAQLVTLALDVRCVRPIPNERPNLPPPKPVLTKHVVGDENESSVWRRARARSPAHSWFVMVIGPTERSAELMVPAATSPPMLQVETPSAPGVGAAVRPYRTVAAVPDGVIGLK